MEANAKTTLKLEATALLVSAQRIDHNFSNTVKAILLCKGRVVITGIGKSAIVAQKIVATLNSTGTPAAFMHAADAVHGDLGTLQNNDIVICISHSGNTPEIKLLAPLLTSNKNLLIAITGNKSSYLATAANYVIDASVSKEACPNNLAPTTSTTVQMALGDALAVALINCRGFSASDFARFHPGGALGKRLYLKIADLVSTNQKPVVTPDDSIHKVIVEISSKRLGATAVIKNNKLLGIITDGDLRRMLEKKTDFAKIKARQIMNAKPKTASPQMLASEAFQLMKENNITQLIVMDNKQFVGFVHLHDLLREGIL
ncbi:MAG: KpsF/GutQ family sugar-phosphate isomerase [Bacteroidetes bacterium]|nr:KpsF/GutQ family sugar-phosphate isomerase [Bacteroidota bacterium]